MKKFAVLVLTLAIVAAACGDDDTADPATIGTCEGLADATIDLTQDVIDTLGDLTPEEFGALTQGEVSPEFEVIADRGEVIGVRAQELECTTLDALVTARADQLTADPTNVMGLLVVEGVQAGDDVMARLLP